MGLAICVPFGFGVSLLSVSIVFVLVREVRMYGLFVRNGLLCGVVRA
jgi:hypothetical protein